MIIHIDLKDAAMIVQSIESVDWSYCGEGDRAERLNRRIRLLCSTDENVKELKRLVGDNSKPEVITSKAAADKKSRRAKGMP